MARVTVEDCLENVENRFELVMLAARRAQQMRMFGADPLVPPENDKPTVLALREIAEGLVSHEKIDAQLAARESVELEAIEYLRANDERTEVGD